LENAIKEYKFCIEVRKVQLGISKNLKVKDFQSWEVIYDHPYNHKCSGKELLKLKADFFIKDEDIICIAAAENDKIILCGTDESRNVFLPTTDH
jgi:hypothetical protein